MYKMASFKEFEVTEKGYEPVFLFSDLVTIEGIASYFKLYSNITGNKKIRIFVDGKKIKANKKYVLAKDIRKIPDNVESDMSFYVITRSSKSYNIYTFNDINFLNGVYIGIGLCREDYKYIIRGFGKVTSKQNYICDENTCKLVKSDGLHFTIDPKDVAEANKIIENLVVFEHVKPEKIEEPKEESATENETETATAAENKPAEKEESKTEVYGINPPIVEQNKSYGYDGKDMADEENTIQPLEEEPRKIVIIRKSPSRRTSNRRLSPRNISYNFESMKLQELKEFADKNKINIKGLSKKSDIINKLSIKN